MAVILEFPIEDVLVRQRIEKRIWDALETHDPETRAEKHRSIMELYDRVASPEQLSISLQVPDGELFSERQIQVITDAMYRVQEMCVRKTREFVLEVAFLKCQVIDLQKK